MNRSHYFNYIEDRLSHLAMKIEVRGKLNILDLHLHSENFYLHFFNELFGWHLENLNAVKPNAEAMDLIDRKNKIVVQVSATATKEKVESALTKDLSAYAGYGFKFISISKDASALRGRDFANPHSLSFDPQADIHDVPSILKLISGFAVDDMHRIADFIARELGGNGALLPPEWELTEAEAKNLRRLVEMVYIVLRCDQITKRDPYLPAINENLPELEGCWGKSLVGIAMAVFHYETKDLFRWQGGITTGVLAGNALFELEQQLFDRNPHQLDYIKMYRNSLFKMQDFRGGFGGIVNNRSTFAPNPSLRHTAAALSIVSKFSSTQTQLHKGGKFLHQFIDSMMNGEELEDSSSLALAMAWLYRTMTDLAEQGIIQIDLLRCQKLLLNRLSSLDDEFHPHWQPFAWKKEIGCLNGKVWTTLTVLKVCPEIVGHEIGAERVKYILKDVKKFMTDDGLRIHDDEPVADIGMTALLAQTLEKLAPFDKFGVVSFNADDNWKLVLRQYDKFSYYRNVWAETLYPVLSLGIKFKDFLKKSDTARLDAVVAAITGDRWRNGEVVVEETVAADYPILKPLLEQMLDGYGSSRFSQTS